MAHSRIGNKTLLVLLVTLMQLVGLGSSAYWRRSHSQRRNDLAALLGPPKGSRGIIDFRYPDSIVEPRVECVSEGYFEHPRNCSWFYRCYTPSTILHLDFFITKFFECAPGTVFQSDIDNQVNKCVDGDWRDCQDEKETCAEECNIKYNAPCTGHDSLCVDEVADLHPGLNNEFLTLCPGAQNVCTNTDCTTTTPVDVCFGQGLFSPRYGACFPPVADMQCPDPTTEKSCEEKCTTSPVDCDYRHNLCTPAVLDHNVSENIHTGLNNESRNVCTGGAYKECTNADCSQERFQLCKSGEIYIKYQGVFKCYDVTLADMQCPDPTTEKSCEYKCTDSPKDCDFRRNLCTPAVPDHNFPINIHTGLNNASRNVCTGGAVVECIFPDCSRRVGKQVCQLGEIYISHEGSNNCYNVTSAEIQCETGTCTSDGKCE